MEEIEGVKLLIAGSRMLVMYYYTLLSGAESNLNQLQVEVGLLRGFLAEASKREGSADDERFRVWEREMSDVIHEADDVIDSCAVQAAAEKNRNIFGRTIGRLSQRNIKLAERVRSLRRERVKPLLDKDKCEFVTFPINNNRPAVTVHAAAAARDQNPRQKNVIPLVRERDALINGLTSSSKNYEVFSIVGMAGLGKTTMAWSIYHDPKIRKTFPIVIWVKISQTFNKKVVCLAILEELGKTEELVGRNLLEMTVDQLSAIICTCLEKGNFVLIMDDVWTHEVWREIKDFLPVDSKHKCKVLITTRVHKVAMYASTGKPYELRPLCEEESWELMRLDVFGNLDTCPPELVDLGKQVARECDGLPFTIVMMAAVLYHKLMTSSGITEAKEEWTRVSRTLRSYGGSENQEKSFSKIISLSFDTLMSRELKDCFLFLGMLPEGADIPVKNLVGMWIAQEYIAARDGSSLEEIAKDFWKELVDKSLLMVGKRKPDGEVKTCHVHDLVRNFCKKEASKQGNKFQEIKQSVEGVLEPGVEEIKACRHICIHSFVVNFLETIMKKLDLRMAYSFLSFSKEAIILEKKDMKSFTNAFKNLRVLHMMGVKFSEFPAKLLLLKYAFLSTDGLSVLPQKLFKLCNLQFLEVNTSSPTIDVKTNIWKLVDLRHFKTKSSVTLSNLNGKGEGGLNNLQTLKMIAPQSCSSKLFNGLNNLRNLGIRGNLTKLLNINAGLEKLVRVVKLELVNGLSPEDAAKTPMSCLPQPNKFPPNVQTLKISGTYLGWNNMSVLAQLGSLEVLKLKGHAFMGYCWDATFDFFNNLQTLQMEDTDLRLWEASRQNFPKLRKLVLINCTNLESVPDDLVKGLDLLYMEGASVYAVSWAQKIENELQEKQGQQLVKGGGFQLKIVSREDEYKYTFASNHTN